MPSTTIADREAHLRGDHSPSMFADWDEAARAGLAQTCVYCARLYTFDGQFILDVNPYRDRRPEPTQADMRAGGPRDGHGSRRHERPATEKQVNLVKKLLSEKDLTGTLYAVPAWTEGILDPNTSERVFAADHMTLSEASSNIDNLFALPRKPFNRPASSPKITGDGMYRKDGIVYKVQFAVHGSGNLYAKQLFVDEETRTGTFEYVAGAVSKLTPADRMSLEEAKEFGRLYGFCVRCGATLTDENSIDAGIGPICAGKI